MPVPDFDDRALDALLSGVPSAQSGLDWLVPFVEELGTVASAPAPVLRPALAVLLREGLPVDTGDEPAPQPAAGRPTGRKTNTRARELIAGLAGRLAGLGLVAKAGLGLTLAAASTAAAGAAGALPAPAQHAVATVVRAATPFTFPDQASSKGRAGAPGTPGVDPTARTDATGASGGSGGSGGVDGKAKDQRATEGSTEPVTVPPAAGTGAGAHTGATGLARAGQTPAAGHVPTSVPNPPAPPGAQSSNGLSTAADTPAAGHVPAGAPPTSSPAHQGEDPAGLSTAATSPAGTHAPAGTPVHP